MVEFDHNQDGAPEGSVTGLEDELVFYDPSDVEPALKDTVGAVRVDYRLTAFDSLGNQMEVGSWYPFGMTLEALPDSDLEFVKLGLHNDTGASETDSVTFDPSIEVEVAQPTGSPTLVTIEFDYDGNGVADATENTGLGASVVHRPSGLAYGAKTIKMRAVEFDFDYDAELFTDWQTVTFTLEAAPPASILELHLADDNGDDPEDGITSDPTLQGRLNPEEGFVSNVAVEIDVDNNGVVDLVTITDSIGAFHVLPDGIAVGTSTVQARSVRFDDQLQADVHSDWKPLTLTYAPVAPPAVDVLSLVEDTGVSHTDLLTTQREIRGRLSGDVVSNVTVELDNDGDGVVDGRRITDQWGIFEYRPSGLTAGSVTIAARSSVWDVVAGAYVQGNWNTITYTLEALVQSALTVDGLSLQTDTGASDTDNVTSIATVTGSVTGDRDYLMVEFDTNGDGQVDAQTTVADDGSFSFTPLTTTLGAHTVAARSKFWDFGSQQGVYGPWASFTFTLEAPTDAVPEITALHLHSDTGVSNSDLYTANSRVQGQVDNEGVNSLIVELDYDGDNLGDGYAAVGEDGHFEYQTPVAEYGSVTVQARAGQWNVATAAYDYGGWQSLTFVLEDQPDSAPELATFGLLEQTDDTFTTNPAVVGSVTNDGSLHNVAVQLDYDGDGTPDEVAHTDSFGRFEVAPVGLPYGATTIAARTSEISEDGQLLQSGWASVTFTYDDPAQQPASVTSISLVNDTGASDSDLVTWDGTVGGQVDTTQLLPHAAVEFDVNGDGDS